MTRRAALIVAATILSAPIGPAYAQVSERELAELGLADLLAVRVVTGARHDQRVIDSPRAITIITADDIRRRNYRSTPEALSEVVGVFVQQTNDGGGAPIIRGLVGNRILLLVDGIRLNSSSYRMGPNQYLNTIDVNSIDRIEVVRGAGSVLYGSDALGGVVNIITKPVLDATGPAVSSRFFTRLSSAEEGVGMVGRGELSGRSGPVSFMAGASLKQFGALRGGRDTGVQPLTGYDEWDADGKLAYRLPANQTIVVAAQRVTQRDIRRPDLNQTWDPQTRSLVYGSYTAPELRGPVDELSITISYQRQAERYTVVPPAGNAQKHFDRTDSIGANVQFTSSIGTRHLLTYGLDLQHDDLTSRRADASQASGKLQAEHGILADGSRYQSQSIFLQDEIGVSPRLRVELGTRYSRYRPRATVGDANTQLVLVDSRPQALTGSAHALFRLTSAMDVVGGVTQGFRAPNINDLTILGPFGGGYEVPNPALRPESSVNLEAGIRGRGLRGSGSATFFVSNFRGLIQRSRGTFQGATFRDFNANGVRDDLEPLVFQRQNAGRGRITGVELDGRLRLSAHWTLAGTFGRVIAEDLITGLPLRRTPPSHGTARLTWSSGGRLWVDGYTMFATHQTRLSPDDLTDSRIPKGGTLGFLTLHARGGMKISRAVELTLALQNLTNRTYRTHGSGIDMPGTNVVFGLEWMF